MVNLIDNGLCFDDVLLVPQYSEIKSRADVDLSVNSGMLKFSHPIIPANMQSVTGADMAEAIVGSGGLAILHRFMPFSEQLQIAGEMCDFGRDRESVNHFGISIGVKGEDMENVAQFVGAGVRLFCIDIAHGNSKHCVEMIRTLRGKYPFLTIIAGNVATGSGAQRLWEAGADVVKVGVGPGSLCTTRIETGNGVPQLSALVDVKKTQQQLQQRDRARGRQRAYPFIADGGIKNAGDVVKALTLADMVMIGNLFAGCFEAPGQRVEIDGKWYKEYVGSSTHKTSNIEGVCAWVPCTDTFDSVLHKLLDGVRSGCSYQGVDNLTDLKEDPIFVKITAAGLKESHPHDITLK